MNLSVGLKYLLTLSISVHMLNFQSSGANHWQFKGSTKISMLCAKSTTFSPQLPENLTVRNSHKQQTTIAKAAGLCPPFKEMLYSNMSLKLIIFV